VLNTLEGNSMKKLIVIASLSTALLASGAAQADWRGNWLLGVSGAHNWYDGSFDHTVDFDTPINPPPATFHNDLDSKGWSWGLLGGYQVSYAEWLFGAEVNVDWHNHDHTQNYAHTVDFGLNDIGSSVSATFKRDTSWGITARVGYEILPCFIPYLRAGIERRDEKLDVVAQTGSVSAFTLNTEDSHNDWRFVGGIGAEAPIPYLAGLTFRAEYNYHPNNKRVESSSTWSVPQATSIVSARQHINTVKASIVYNFTI